MTDNLSYLELVEEKGRAIASAGTVKHDDVDALADNRNLHGRGIRIYVSEAAPRGSSLDSLQSLVAQAPLVITCAMQKNAARTGHLISDSSKLIGSGQRKCARRSRYFASFNARLHRFKKLDERPAGSIDELVSSWARVHGKEDVLLELDASVEALRAMLQSLRSHPMADEKAPGTPLPGLPLETDASATRRTQLASEWMDAAQASATMGSRARNLSKLANQYRQDGRLLGVWIRGENRYRFPHWQFNAQGNPIPQMEPLLRILRGPHGVAAGHETSGWEEVEWFYGPHARLDKKRPADMMGVDPQRVLAVAESEFTDARW